MSNFISIQLLKSAVLDVVILMFYACGFFKGGIMYYPDELINEVVVANDIVDIVSSYVKLSRSGRTHRGLCPFHGEKTPSFYVSGDKQLYHCFGCGAGGTVLQFIMNIENLDFIEAVKFLAQRANIALPEGNENSSDSKTYKLKQRIYEMNAFAAKLFNKTLFSKENTEAQQYLLRRNLDDKTAIRFGLGFAPESFGFLTEALLSNGFTEEEILISGLAKKSEKNGKLYDFFRNRIMFPIIDVRGNVVAFGGRVTDDSLPKYLNSPDTPVFNKSRTLFGLNFAKRNCTERLILCEGYMDVIALHKAGFTNAVAALGTAFTEEHARVISRYTTELVLCHDSDSAGRKATDAALNILKKFNIKTKVLTVKGAKDPDEFIKKNGGEAFKRLLEDSPGSINYKIESLMHEYNITNSDDKIELTNKLAAVFADISNPIEREVLIKDCSKMLDISFETISAQVNFIKSRTVKKEETKELRPIPAKKRTENFNLHSECALLMLMTGDKRIYLDFKDKISPSFFTFPASRNFAEELYKSYENNINPDLAILLSKLSPEDASVFSAEASSEIAYTDARLAAEDIYVSLTNKHDNPNKKIESADELSALLARMKKIKNK